MSVFYECRCGRKGNTILFMTTDTFGCQVLGGPYTSMSPTAPRLPLQATRGGGQAREQGCSLRS